MAALKARVAAAIGTSKAKGGLNVGLHPALEDLGSYKPSSKSKESTPTPSGSRSDKPRSQDASRSTSVNRESGENPYFDASSSAQPGGGKARQSRSLVFNQKGKYIAQANALRRQAALEAMKKRIAEQTRKAGIDDDLDVERNFVVEAPPEIEWWDEGLVEGGSYDVLDDPSKLKLTTPDSIITEYIQHPVALEPPQDGHVPAAKPMFLVKKERKKLRRQRRMAELKEMQAKIRLGLVPAPPPKVKKGNLMRVLGDGKSIIHSYSFNHLLISV
jgi:U4/U6 small nuclear ribonucleoprotein PRP3